MIPHRANFPVSVRPSVRPSVHPSVCQHESKSGETRISAPAHPSATDGRVSGLVAMYLLLTVESSKSLMLKSLDPWFRTQEELFVPSSPKETQQ